MLIVKLGFLGGSDGKESACNAVEPLGLIPKEDPLEKGMATHSSILAWRIPWAEEPGGLQSMGPKKLDTTEQLTLSLFHINKIKDNKMIILIDIENHLINDSFMTANLLSANQE